jgi:hypothetical protein
MVSPIGLYAWIVSWISWPLTVAPAVISISL